LTGPTLSLRVKVFPTDERNLEAVERLVPILEAAGLSLATGDGV
jgi:hypothetical protein